MSKGLSLSVYIYLSVCLSVCILYLSICLSLCLHLSICLSLRLHLSICLSLFVYLSVSLSLSVTLSVSLSLSVTLSVSLCHSLCLSLFVSVSLSVCLSVCLSVSSQDKLPEFNCSLCSRSFHCRSGLVWHLKNAHKVCTYNDHVCIFITNINTHNKWTNLN